MKKVYKRKEEGIASVIGTIFALMIFTALLGMFMTQVVPVTMKDNEARHDTRVLSQLSQLRSEVDILTLTKDTNYTAYVPIKLGADGIPLFASPTDGQLSLYPAKLSSNYVMNVSFADKYGNLINKSAAGSLQFIAPNRYYIPELFEYANGAILRYNFNSNSTIFSINPNIRFQGVSLGSMVNVSSSKYVNVSSSSSLNPSYITVETWFNLRSLPSSYTPLLSKNNEYQLQVKSTSLEFNINGGAASVTYPVNLEKNRWYYVAGTYDGSSLKLYFNGKLVNSNSASVTLNSNDNEVDIGKIDGFMDEIRILNKALTDDEIAGDYYSGIYYPDRTDTVLWYHCDNLTADGKLYDSSDYHNDGTLHGANLEPRTGVNIATTLQSIFGRPDSVTGTETRNIAISLYGVSSESYELNGGILNISLNDFYRYSTSFSLDFTDSWIEYMNSTLSNIGLRYEVDYTISGSTITIYGANTVNLNMVYLSFEITR